MHTFTYSPLFCPLLFGSCARINFYNNTPLYAFFFFFSVDVLSLARATLVLIPLLGIHEVVFTVLIDECVEGSSRYARNFINLTLSSFQVTPVKSPAHMRQEPSCSESTLNTSCDVYPYRDSWLLCSTVSQMERYVTVKNK